LFSSTDPPPHVDTYASRSEGNIRFRATIERNLPRYERGTRKEKSKLIGEVVASVRMASRRLSPGGSDGFVRKDLLTRRWYRVDDKIARERCGQAFRDMVKSKRLNVAKTKSTNKSSLQDNQEIQSDSDGETSAGSKRQKLRHSRK